MKLIFLHGMPGVGKLTVAQELAALTGYKLFHNHLTVDLVGAVFPFGSGPFVELRELIWIEMFRQAAAAKLPGLIFTFAYDRTVSKSFIANATSAVAAAGGEILFVELRCTDEELERRLTEPSRGKYGKLNSLEFFRELKQAGAFVDPGIPEQRLVIDITEMSPAETARMIVKAEYRTQNSEYRKSSE
jgi:hypothetical protein